MTALDPDGAGPAAPTASAAVVAPIGGPWPEPWCAQPWNRARSEYWDLLTGTWVPCPQADSSGPRAGA